ncbi:hypothetical protein [uncultured Nostoc sp.]|uniref:hypothetical protein n=1 Tax=uncultured Nostoc sp. TaxID=340711 RepID=UPI0035C957E6
MLQFNQSEQEQMIWRVFPKCVSIIISSLCDQRIEQAIALLGGGRSLYAAISSVTSLSVLGSWCFAIAIPLLSFC